MSSSKDVSPESRELALVGKVEMRIALADTDSKLQSLLSTYLPPLLLKLGSDSIAVRNKVISVCQHVNTRIKSEDIQLPVGALLKQFKDTTTALIRHFDVLYIQQGWPRLQDSQQLDLLPDLIDGISQTAVQNPEFGSQLFHMVLHIFHKFKLPARGSNEDHDIRNQLRISDDDARFLASWFGKLMLFTPDKSVKLPATQSTFPGLTATDYNFLMCYGKPSVWDSKSKEGLNLISTKMLATTLLASGLFLPSERLLPALCASADSNLKIAADGEEIVKRTLSEVNVNDEALISQLYGLYLGSQVPSVNIPVRIKLLNLLAKSQSSASHVSNILEIVENALISNRDESSGRLKQKFHAAVFGFILSVSRNATIDDLKRLGPELSAKLRAFVEDAGWPTQQEGDLSLRGLAYEYLGIFAKVSSIVDVSLVSWLFKSLSEDLSSSETGASIQEALLNMISLYKNANISSEIQESLRRVLSRQFEEATNITKPDTNMRRRKVQYVATRFANECLAYDDGKLTTRILENPDMLHKYF
jgi:proteasome component ECM29